MTWSHWMGRVEVLYLFLLGFCLPSSVLGASRNITIDDQFGDALTGQIPVYRPKIAWATQKCSTCKIRPNTSEIFNSTYTAATFMPDQGVKFNAIDFSFTGTAIYIFFTLFNFEGEGITVNTECNFTLNREHVGYFKHIGDNSLPYQTKFQALVFNKTDLEPREHNMLISVSGVPYHVYLNFDYAIYTQLDDGGQENSVPIGTLTGISHGLPSTVSSGAPIGISSSGIPIGISSSSTPESSSSASRAPVGAIIGGTLGGSAVLLGFVALLWFYMRSRKQIISKNNTHDLEPSKDTNSTDKDIFVYPKPPSPRPIKPRLFPMTPARSIHGGSTVISDLESPPQLSPTSSKSFPTLLPLEKGAGYTGHTMMVPTYRVTNASSNEGNSDDFRAPPRSRLLEEVRRLRQELSSLRQGVASRKMPAS
ncbi:hypothetical protein D9756_001313 [Leucocoprinus leucothites]|uniref:Uncharacterized protein n=1 Tax=Leucocoprinus leucothites TaxID=201217 RepID=A0A8H5LI71_9AGAR|nr:hypothetical protein D9756_001313 [Leucoagaricus leucothites]